MKKTFAFLALALLLALPAQAQDRENPADKYTVLNLTETAERKVAQDRLQASLAVEEKAMSAAEAQSAVNDKMAAALKTAKGYTEVQVSTGYYQAWQEQPAGLWHARQTIEMKSANSKQMLDLVGALQKTGLQASGLTYYLSDEAQKALYDTLVAEALQKMKARADKTAAVLGLKVARFAEITPGFNYQPVFRDAMMMNAKSAATAAPSAEGSEQSVTVSVSARIYLQ